jgi:hypothetical protein
MSDGHLFDPVRGKDVRALPEERVRRQLVDWLITTVGVPQRLVSVEFALAQLDPTSRRRADVVVWRPGRMVSESIGEETGSTHQSSPVGLSPWLLAECKAPGVALAEAVADQVRSYAARIRAEHVLVTNGADTQIFKLVGERYEAVAGLSLYPDPRVR